MEENKKPEDLLRSDDEFEVTELDDRDLEGVAGGNEIAPADGGNTNCGCNGREFTGGSGNENCGC